MILESDSSAAGHVKQTNCSLRFFGLNITFQFFLNLIWQYLMEIIEIFHKTKKLNKCQLPNETLTRMRSAEAIITDKYLIN